MSDGHRHDMLFDAISGHMMTGKERVLFGFLGLIMMLWDLALVVAPVYVYTEHGFEPAVIAGFVVLVMTQVMRE